MKAITRLRQCVRPVSRSDVKSIRSYTLVPANAVLSRLFCMICASRMMAKGLLVVLTAAVFFSVCLSLIDAGWWPV